MTFEEVVSIEDGVRIVRRTAKIEPKEEDIAVEKVREIAKKYSLIVNISTFSPYRGSTIETLHIIHAAGKEVASIYGWYIEKREIVLRDQKYLDMAKEVSKAMNRNLDIIMVTK